MDKGVSVETTVKITIKSPLRGSVVAFGPCIEPISERHTEVILSMEDARALWAELGHTIRAKKVTE